MEEKYHSLLQVNAKQVEMIEIFGQLKKQAKVIGTKTAERFFVFKQLKGKQNGLRNNTNSV